MYRVLLAFTVLSFRIVAQVPEQSELFTGVTTENFITRWGYQSLCHHTFDPRTNEFMWPSKPGGATFNPEIVQPGDLIFVRDVPLFIKTVHRKIPNPYIMITAGEWRDQVKKEHLDFLDDEKIIAWFSVHPCSKVHPKFFPLPLGIYQDKRIYNKKSELSVLFRELRHTPKTQLLYMNYRDIKGKKPERFEVTKLFQRASFCYKVTHQLPFVDYMKEMSRFKFTLSPKGYGPDLYRNWEAMLVGSIPIVKTSHMDHLYADLPILIVKDWKEVTEQFLEKKYQEMKEKKFSVEKLGLEYWSNKIMTVREQFLQVYKN